MRTTHLLYLLDAIICTVRGLNQKNNHNTLGVQARLWHRS